ELEIDNVRELIGALNRLVAGQAAGDAPLTPAEARALIAKTLPARAPVVTRAEPVAAAEPASGGVDEFADFLQEVSATVTQQVESWRARIAEAILRWEGEGYRVARLQALLDADVTADPADELRAFEADVGRLRELQDELEAMAPDLAGATALRDPGNLGAAEAFVERARQGAAPPPAPSPHWNLAEFIETASNRMAVRAARSVTEEPGTRYNPLVITGASGNGKTHLLHGIGNALAAGGITVACIGAAEFVDELISAIDRDGVGLWRARYRHAGALLLDDVHLIAGKERTQEELFVLFNLMLDTGRQMVFTSAVPLAELAGVEDRLRTRLEGGLVVDLPEPDRELRERAIERLLSARLEAVDPEFAAYVAGRPAESMRASLGLVQRVLNAAETKQVHPTAALAREVLEGPVQRAPRKAVPVRPSGVAPSSALGVRSREKMVWEWPDIGARIIEEWR